jgi:hypothetical protein
VPTNDTASSTGFTVPGPTTAEEALDHLVGEHGWQQSRPDSAMLTAHDLAHGGQAGSTDWPTGHRHTSPSNPPRHFPGVWAYVPTAAAGLGLMGIGLLLSWVSVVVPIGGDIHRIGLDTVDGKLIAVAALLLGLLLGREQRQPARSHRALLLTIAAVVAATLWYDWHDLLHRLSGVDSELAVAQVRPGLFLTAVGTGLFSFGVLCRAHLLAPGALAADLARAFAALRRGWLSLPRWARLTASVTALAVVLGGPIGWHFIDASRHAAIKDAAIGDCLKDNVTVEITNKTSSVADYTVTVGLFDPSDKELSHDTVSSTRIQPGQKRTVRVSNLDLATPWKYCQVDSATRTAS